MAVKSLRTNDWLEQEMKKHSDLVYRLAYSQVQNREHAEDIYQEVFLRLYQSDVQFQNAEHEKAWLIRVTVNCGKSFKTSAWSRHTVPLEEDLDMSKPEAEDTSDVTDAVCKLPPKYRTVVHLFYYEDMPVADIATALNKTVSAVTVQLCRARRMLKEALKGEYDFEEL